jgi:chromosome partitioning protein
MAELVISCLSQKGGVGKSTLSRLIATMYANAGWSVKIADFNVKQKTSVDWVAMRLQNGIEPAIAAEPMTSTRSFKRDAVDLIVVDGKPDSDVSSLDAAKASDLIVIPTDVSIDDLKPQVLFANELVKHGIERGKMLFVLNKSGSSTTHAAAAREYMTSVGYRVAEAELRRLAPYNEAQNTGRSICETVRQDLNERALAVGTEIVAMIHEREQK